MVTVVVRLTQVSVFGHEVALNGNGCVCIFLFWHELKGQSSKSAAVRGTSYRSDANRKSRETYYINIRVKL